MNLALTYFNFSMFDTYIRVASGKNTYIIVANGNVMLVGSSFSNVCLSHVFPELPTLSQAKYCSSAFEYGSSLLTTIL